MIEVLVFSNKNEHSFTKNSKMYGAMTTQHRTVALMEVRIIL